MYTISLVYPPFLTASRGWYKYMLEWFKVKHSFWYKANTKSKQGEHFCKPLYLLLYKSLLHVSWGKIDNCISIAKATGPTHSYSDPVAQSWLVVVTECGWGKLFGWASAYTSFESNVVCMENISIWMCIQIILSTYSAALLLMRCPFRCIYLLSHIVMNDYHE